LGELQSRDIVFLLIEPGENVSLGGLFQGQAKRLELLCFGFRGHQNWGEMGERKIEGAAITQDPY
jgi:hypothetical protein